MSSSAQGVTHSVAARTDERSDAIDAVRARRLANLKPWRPGVSGNPRGDSKAASSARQLARQYGPEAIARIVNLMRGKNRRLALDAAKELLARAYGRPVQPQSLIDEEGNDRELLTPPPTEASELEVARRIAFLLDLGLRSRKAPREVHAMGFEEPEQQQTRPMGPMW